MERELYRRCFETRFSYFLFSILRILRVRGFHTGIFALFVREQGVISTKPSTHRALILIPTVPEPTVRGVEVALCILSLSGGSFQPEATELQGVWLFYRL